MYEIKIVLYLLKKWFKYFRWFAVLYIISNALQPIIYIVKVFIISRLFDTVVALFTSRNSEVLYLGIPVSILYFLALYLIAFVVEFIVYYVSDYTQTRLNMYRESFHDTIIGSKYLEISAQQFENPKIARKMAMVRDNMWKISEYPQYLSFGISWGIGLLIVLGILLKTSVFYGLLFLLFLILRFKIYSKFGIAVYTIWQSDAEIKMKFYEYNSWPYSTDINTITEMRVMNFHKWLLDKSIKFNIQFAQKYFKEYKKNLDKNFLLNISYVLAIVFVYFDLIRKLLAKKLLIGQFYFITGLLGYVGYFSDQAFSGFSYVLKNQKIIEAFYEFSNLKPAILNGANKQVINEIEFKDVWFKYSNTKKWVLKNINFKIKLGDKIALVGQNGAGKTTLIKLLLRIYDPTKGRILINGVDLRKLDLNTYYRQIGLLSQDFVSPRVPVWENIYLGRTDKPKDLEKIKEAAQKAKAHEFIEKLPKKYNTWLNRELTDGAFLSGGQWQRLAIARVFYKDPTVIILDEPTSAIDALAERQIFDEIFSQAKDKIVLVVSHRLGSIQEASKIFVLKDGEIVEQGTFDSLINKKDGEFYKMWIAQQRIKEDAF